MTYKKIFGIIIFILCFGYHPTFGTHVYGGEITWDCVSSGADAGKFIFKIKLYKACYQQSAGLGSTTSISNPLYAQYGGPASISCTRVSITDLSQSCYNPYNQIFCGGALATNGKYAIEEHKYVSDPIQINGIPSSTGSEFTWTSCCRPTSVNITGSAYYLRAKMFPYIEPGTSTPKSLGTASRGGSCYDSSPEFAVRPVATVCGKQNSFFSHQTFDKDGDDSRYQWERNKISATNPVMYTSGYNLSNQLPNSSQHSNNVGPVLDTLSGLMTFNTFSPLNAGFFNVGTRTRSYRDGQKIAEVYRDVHVSIINCDTISSNPKVYNTASPTIEIKESSASVYQNSFNKTYNIGSNIQLDIRSIDLGSIPTNPIDKQSVDIEVIGNEMSSNPNSATGCGIGPCAYLDSNNASWNGTIFQDTSSLIVQFHWNTSCSNADFLGDYNGTPRTKTFYFSIISKDNWCPVPATSIMNFSITLVDSSSGTWRMDSIDASGQGVKLFWPQFNGTNFSSYVLHKKNDMNDPWSFLRSISNAMTTNYIDLAGGLDTVALFYKIDINDTSGCGEKPFKTIRLKVTRQSLKPSLNWTSPNLNSTNYQGKYFIYRLIGNGQWTLIDSTWFNFLKYDDQTAPLNQKLKYKVVAENNNDVRTISNIDTITIKYSGIEELNSKDIFVYPNPFKDELVIELSNERQYELQIYNAEGKMLYSEQLNNQRNAINTLEFPEGVYYLRFTNSEGRIFSKKIVKME